jgi:membrane-bound serine protease (ClpP class)
MRAPVKGKTGRSANPSSRFGANEAIAPPAQETAFLFVTGKRGRKLAPTATPGKKRRAMYRLLPALFWLMALPAFAAHLDGIAPAPSVPAPAVDAAPEKPSPVQTENVPGPEAQKAIGAVIPASTSPTRVLVIPVRDQIADPILYIIRRGLKSAGKNDLVVLDMETPGGALGAALEIMKALDQFEGHTATYVNGEAISAGAFISAVTQNIYFAPKGVIGAAAAVSSEGADIPETMRLKVNSYLKAKVRAYSEGRGFRAQVISSMMDKDYEFKIGDTVIKPKGELLSLTDVEAAKTYGEPPVTLLSSGTYKTLADLLDARFGAGNYRIEQLEITWSETLAQHLTNYTSIVLGLGLLFIFIEFKTPGFGFFGIAGGALLLLVFFGSYVAGFSGYEPALVFALGLLLVLVELIFFPGVVVVALTGIVLIFGSLLWAMADLWPAQPFTFSGEVFVRPLQNLGLGLAVALVLGAVALRYLPRGWFFQRMAVNAAASTPAQLSGGAPQAGLAEALVGARGVVVSGLFPSGQIEIDGRRYEARLEVGTALAGTVVVVRRASDFNLVVETVT